MNKEQKKNHWTFITEAKETLSLAILGNIICFIIKKINKYILLRYDNNSHSELFRQQRSV